MKITEEGIERLVGLLIDLIIFIASLDGDLIDEDISVKMLESVIAEVQELSAEDMRLFVDSIRRNAQRSRESGNVRRADLVDCLPEDLGLE